MKNRNYQLTLKTVGRKYKNDGETVDQALAKLNLSWEQIKGKGVIKIFKDGKSYEHLFYLNQLKRIFANKITRLMWGKRLELLLKAGKDKEAYRKE